MAEHLPGDLEDDALSNALLAFALIGGVVIFLLAIYGLVCLVR